MTRAPSSKRRTWPVVGYAASAALHLALFGWAWALPARARRNEKIDVEIVEAQPKPVEPEPPKPEPPKPEPVKVRPMRRVAMTAPPPVPTEKPPPEEPPPEAPQVTTPGPAPVHLGLSLSSTSVGGAFAAPVGNSLYGKAAPRTTAPADDVGAVVRAASLNVEPEPVDTDIPAGEYPKQALDAGFEGQVTLKLVIDASGRVRRASALKDPGYGLGAAAVKSALKHFRFKPIRMDGKPVAVEFSWTITYELP
jgi:periplasmic protein TonB